MAVTIIGDAFIDIVVPIYGIKPGETYHRNMSISCGGTANVAVQVAKLDEEVGFMGKVGDDALGLYFRKNLRNNKVKDFTFVDKNHPTGLCVSLFYESGEQGMIANRGANDYLTRVETASYLKQVLKSKIVYFSGYSLVNNPETVTYTMKECRPNCEVWFNPGAPNIVESSTKSLVHELVDVLILNLAEAKSITQEDEISEIAAKLGQMAELSVVTLGKNGCVVSGTGEWTQLPINDLVTGVDTTGAGDAFAAGFIAGKMRNISEFKCAKLANEVAANFLRQKVVR